MTTERINDFIRSARPATPCLVLDVEAARTSYRALREALPGAAVYYAVKANPEPALLEMLVGEGSGFDTASPAEIQMALRAGAGPDRVSYGNTIKKERDVAEAFRAGVNLFAVDSEEEVAKVARAAPGASVYCRILTDGEGAEWPLSRKFGCDVSTAVKVAASARDAGLVPVGVSFHVGSQQTDLSAWSRAVADAADVFRASEGLGIHMDFLNMGGGFPARYLKDVPCARAYGEAISDAVTRHFPGRPPRTAIEPGRGLVGNAGAILAEVVLVSRKAEGDLRWVYLDVGRFGGLAETMDEAIRYRITTPRDHDAMEPCVVAGPTCDSADVLYEKNPYPLPISLVPGDQILIEGTGAYTTTYSAVAFNGFEPLACHAV